MSVIAPLNGLEPPAFRLTYKRESQLRHRGLINSWLLTYMSYRKRIHFKITLGETIYLFSSNLSEFRECSVYHVGVQCNQKVRRKKLRGYSKLQ